MYFYLDTREREDEELEQEEETRNEDLPIRQYLDKHIMGSLIEALEKLTNDKPEDPIQFIGEFMLQEEENMKAIVANKRWGRP